MFLMPGRRWLRVVAALLCCLWLGISRVGAQTTQTEEDPAREARIHFGPLALDPGFFVRDVGVDTNVFREPENPKRDFTATFGPKIDAWLRLGRARVTGKSTISAIYYRKYPIKGLFETENEAKIEFPLKRITPWAMTEYDLFRRHATTEIDARVTHSSSGLTIGADVEMGAKTIAVLAATRSAAGFDAVQFEGVNLRDTLNRVSEGISLELRHDITALTNVFVSADGGHDRFDVIHLRDSDTYRAQAGVVIGAFALISGSASIGYRSFQMLNPALPDYKGPVGSASLAHTAFGVTHISVGANRDVEYSFDDDEPYYLFTNVSASIIQRLGASWDVTVVGSRGLLDYRQALEGAAVGKGHSDRVETLGGGIGYHLNGDVRLGIDVSHERRFSDLVRRRYEGWRFGGSGTYGF